MTLGHTRVFVVWLWLAAAMLALVAGDAVADERKKVFALYSGRRDAQMSIVGDRELPHLLELDLGQSTDFYPEYLDFGRFPESSYEQTLVDFLSLKYRSNRFDVVIAIQDVAVDFLRRNRAKLFPDTPVVFFATTWPERQLPNSTGIVTELNLTSTLTLAAQLQPDVRNVYIVSGKGTPERGYEALTRAQLRRFDSRFNATYLSGLPTRDLEARLAALPDHSIVYYLLVYQDGNGELFNPIDYLDRVTAAARVPTYSWTASTLDHGVVGGSLLDQAAVMRALAELALRIVRGESADDIAVESRDLNTAEVDWRQLRRWHIDEARVPAGAVVRFRQLSVWSRYRGYILLAATVFVAQSALILGLYFQRVRRREAEALVVRSRAELRTSYDRIRDLAGRLLHAQETERARIARELHDDVGQQMVLLEIDLGLLESADPRSTAGLAAGALSRARVIAGSVKDLSHRLHPATLRQIGLVPALQGLQRELSHPEIAIKFVHTNVPSLIPAETTVCLFRVVQEALHNALKYSSAREVSVWLTGTPRGIALTIMDDGIGFDVAASVGKGLGLVSMGERLEAIGGTFEIHSTPGGGTRLDATVPLVSGAQQTSVAV